METKPLCKIAQETGDVPLACLFECQRADCTAAEEMAKYHAQRRQEEQTRRLQDTSNAFPDLTK